MDSFPVAMPTGVGVSGGNQFPARTVSQQEGRVETQEREEEESLKSSRDKRLLLDRR